MKNFDTNLSTVSSVNFNGIPCFHANVTQDYDQHYISYNNYDTDDSLYGDVTTAIVDNNMYRFIVLNGDHRKQLAGLSLQQSIDYAIKNANKLNKRSDVIFGSMYFPWCLNKK